MTVATSCPSDITDCSTPPLPLTTQSFHMAAMDLDGTLLHSNHCVSVESAQYLRELEAKGFSIMIATGRAIATVHDTIRQLHPLTRPLPVVCSNGAQGYMVTQDGDTLTQNLVFSTVVPMHVVQETIRLAKQLGHVTQYYVDQGIYANPSQPHHFELTRQYQELTGSQTIYVQDDFGDVMQQYGLPSKLLVLCPPEQQQDAMTVFCDAMSEMNPDNDHEALATIILGSMGWFLEVLHPQVCKGQGLVKMCQHLEVNINDVVAFGDAENDVEFIQQAGWGIVMNNGRDIAKKVADEVMEWTNDDDGVRRTLQRMQNKGQLVFGATLLKG